MSNERTAGRVLGLAIDAINWHQATDRIIGWALDQKSRYVALCNVHVTASAAHDKAYRRIIERADIALPDGAPVAWVLRRIGFSGQPRISGPDLTSRLLHECAQKGIGVYFYGSTERVLSKLEAMLAIRFPDLPVMGMASPPFRPLTKQEDRSAVKRINQSGAGIVFVGLGCPKQEKWMFEHRHRISGVQVGVGAAFDFHAGTLRRAPLWMRRAGLEWLHRFGCEPSRLWRRYLVSNLLFSWGVFWQFIRRIERGSH